MPAEVTMPQLSDTMTEGTVVKWRVKEGEKVKAGQVFADIETDKAVMETETFDGGIVALIAVAEGQKVKVGALLAVIARGSESAEEVRKQYAKKTAAPAVGDATGAGAAPAGGGAGAPPPAAPARPPSPTGVPVSTARAAAPADKAPMPAAGPAVKPAARPRGNYQYDILVIGGGPGGYAAAIRAGQLKKRVLCVERENLGGTCLNWGCIPTKALLEDGSFIRKLRTHAEEHGVRVQGMQVDFARIIGRSRGIADQLKKGIGSLFYANGVKHEEGVGQLLGPHRVKITGKSGTSEVTAEHIILAVGAKSTPLPGVPFDGKKVITSREAMTLPRQPGRLAIVGAGAIGCEFADFYNALGTEVTIIEMLPTLLPNEDEDVSRVLRRSFEERGIKVHLETRTEKVDTSGDGVKLTLSGKQPGGQHGNPAGGPPAPAPATGAAPATIEADLVLVAIGVSGNVENLAAPEAKLELFKNRVKTDHEYRTSVEDVWAVGDCVSIHWPEHMSMGGYRHPDLAHVAHHEAVLCVERICGFKEDDGGAAKAGTGAAGDRAGSGGAGDHGVDYSIGHAIDYKFIPGCTYTHPQVASMGYTEKKAREAGHQVRVGRFPFSASGRALAAGETVGMVKLIFDAKYGELLGVHMIGETVTELLSELVLARKLEATESEIIEAMHPHPTYSEAVMEAAGQADGRAIHITSPRK